METIVAPFFACQAYPQEVRLGVGLCVVFRE